MFRSLLFVPGTRPDRFDKAAASGADAICIDLEDAVAPPQRAEARASVCEYLQQRGKSRAAIGIRINNTRCADGVRDLAAVLDGAWPDFLVAPKVDYASELGVFAEAFGGRLPIWPIIESARALENVWEIARASAVKGFIFGAADFSADVRCAMEWEPLFTARSLIAAAAGGARIELMDVPHIDVADPEGLRTTTLRVRAMGFTGRTCIHPTQLSVVNEAFTPSEQEVARARAIIEAFANSKGGVALYEGKLIEKPLILVAEQVLERASAGTNR